jgi:hypothetical protein
MLLECSNSATVVAHRKHKTTRLIHFGKVEAGSLALLVMAALLDVAI